MTNEEAFKRGYDVGFNAAREKAAFIARGIHIEGQHYVASIRSSGTGVELLRRIVHEEISDEILQMKTECACQCQTVSNNTKQ